MDEQAVIRALRQWLRKRGWRVRTQNRGADIVAKRGRETWIIEAKGAPQRPQQRRNYFLDALGEILQRMDSCRTKYSVAFPYVEPYIRLWDKLPRCAKHRTRLTALFVDEDFDVREVF